MSGPDQTSRDQTPDKPSDFEARLAKARAEHGLDATPDSLGGPTGSWGKGLRAGIELVSALIVGGAIGYGLDWWLGTRPILMGIFLLLGAIAGVMNVVRLSLGRGDR
jgi:ATP synthase protein I